MFAANILVPPADYQAFLKRGEMSLSEIVKFAEQINIHPGIVVGRLQHDGYLEHNQGNDLRIKYQFAK